MLEFQYKYLAGDPNARHQPQQAYRAPFAIATNHPITQAFPQVATHISRDSQYAIDIAMPIGTDIMARDMRMVGFQGQRLALVSVMLKWRPIMEVPSELFEPVT